MTTTVHQLRCRIAIATSRLLNETKEQHQRGQSAKKHELPLRKLAALLRGVNNTWSPDMIDRTSNWLRNTHGV
jgi:hypothetical protein